MRLIIAGGRETIVTPKQINDALNDLDRIITAVISGGARGVDKCGEIWAEENNIKIERYLPMYQEFGKLAPKVRNRDMAIVADGLLAFWDGMSPGTAHIIATMIALKKWVKVILLDDKDFEDTKLIECVKCGNCLNGKSLWVTSETDPKTLCETCYGKRIIRD